MAVTIRRTTGLANNREWDEWATLLDAVIYDADAQKNKYKDLVSALTMEKKSKNSDSTLANAQYSFKIMANSSAAPPATI